jgi:hypothetical protein
MEEPVVPVHNYLVPVTSHKQGLVPTHNYLVLVPQLFGSGP